MYDVPTHLRTVEILKAAIANGHESIKVPDLKGAIQYAFAALPEYCSHTVHGPKQLIAVLTYYRSGPNARMLNVYQEREEHITSSAEILEALKPVDGPQERNREPIPPTGTAELDRIINPIEPVATQHMVDLTPNITVDQAKRMEDALNRRHAAGEELVRLFKELLHTGLSGHLKRHNLQESLAVLDQMQDARKEYDEHNRTFTDAVFEKRPVRI